MMGCEHSTAAGEEKLSDLRESLDMMREMTRSRIAMLRDGVTFHNEEKKVFYLREYEAKLKELDQEIRRLSLRLIHPDR